MPELRWVTREEIEPDRSYVVMASRLPLRGFRYVPGFLRDTMRIRRQLATTGGLVGYGLKADLGRKTFWTFSVWADRASLDAFAATDPHRRIIERLRPRMGESRFAFLELRGSEVPNDWGGRTAPVR